MKRLFYVIVALLILVACDSSNQFVITGTIENGEGKDLIFSELLMSGTEEIEKIKLEKNGSFKIKSTTDIPRFYHLSVSKSNFLTLLIEPGENFSIKADAKNMNYSQIEGSQGSVFVQKLNNQLSEAKQKLDSILNYAESIKDTKDFDKKVDAINKSYTEIVDRQRDSSIAFIINNLSSMASIVALYQKYDDDNFVLYKNRDLQYIKIVSEALEKKHPESKHVKALLADKENLFKRYNQLKITADVNKLAQNAVIYNVPEIFLPNQSGDSISLNEVN